MLLHKSRQAVYLQRAADGVVGCVALWAAFTIRTHLLPGWFPVEVEDIGEFSNYAGLVLVVLVLGPFVLNRLQFYRLPITNRMASAANLALQGAIIVFLLLICSQFYLKSDTSRLVFVFYVPIYAGLLVLRTSVFEWWTNSGHKRGVGLSNVLVVLDGSKQSCMAMSIKANPSYGVRVSREINLVQTPLSEFVQILHDESVEIVIFDVHQSSFDLVVQAMRACEEEGIECWLAADFLETTVATTKVDYFEQRPILVFRSTPDDSWQLMVKAAIDRMVALLALVVLGPLFIVIALLIKLGSPGPVFFCQQRSGRHGRPFDMYKFRTMVTNAAQLQNELAHLNEMSGPVFKVTNDPRITKIGAFLRKTSLDELPQLYNVFLGEMSLVGPRPLPVYETLSITENAQRRRLSVKPGLTCLWQIQGRNEVLDFKEWVRLDLEYIDRWSLWLDFKILFLTVPVVLFGKGAK
jgi:exopolysaccharide biosynthesis polyprenyl glycosylphosphotransferase